MSPQRIFCSWVYIYFVVKFRTLVMGETKEILTNTIPKKTYMYPCELTLLWQMEHTDHCPFNWCCSGLAIAWQLEHTDHYPFSWCCSGLAWQLEHTDHCPTNWCCSGLEQQACYLKVPYWKFSLLSTCLPPPLTGQDQLSVMVTVDKVTHNVDVCVCGSLIVSIFEFNTLMFAY